MPDEHLKSDEDVEQILRLAVQMPGGMGSEDLRSRLNAVAEEMGISPEQLQQAEEQYRAEKDRKEAMEEYVKEQRANFFSNLIPYILVSLGCVFWDFRSDSSISWSIWVIIGWGIGVVGHAISAFSPNSSTYTKDFERWKRRRDRRKQRREGGVINVDEEIAEKIESRLSGVHIVAGNKIITPKLVVTDLNKSDQQEKAQDEQS